MSQMDQSGNATSSQFDPTESTRMDQINQAATPPSTEHSETDTTDVTWKTDTTPPSKPPDAESSAFWTACPYCYVLYKYPKVYEDCTLRCQAENCRRAFHAVVIPSPPPVDGKETYLCTMGFFPLGFSGNAENIAGNFRCWSPVSTMFACPDNKNAGKRTSAQESAPRVFYNEDDVYIEISSAEDTNDDDDDDDKWQKEKRKKKAKGKGSVVKNAKTQKRERVNGNGRGVPMVPEAEPSERGVANSGYVEGLEEFLSSLHMLAVGRGR